MSDKADDNGVHEWPGKLTSNPRAYTPSDTESDAGVFNDSDHNGDWSWKPKRNEAFPQFGMPALKTHRHPLEGIRF